MPLHEIPKVKSFLIRQLRIILIAIRGFFEDKVQLRASALTFYSLLSIVPTLAMIFGIAKGFGFQAKLEEELVKGFQGHEEVLNWIINIARNYLENVKGGFIAGVGLIVLLGAEISYANQNVAKYEFQYDSMNISYKLRRILSLLIVKHVINVFEKGEAPLTSYQLAKELKIPVKVVRDITFDLTEAGLFSETLKKNPKEKGLQPARDINTITVHSVFKKLEDKGMKKMTSASSKEYLKITDVVQKFEDAIEKSPSNILLKDI